MAGKKHSACMCPLESACSACAAACGDFGFTIMYPYNRSRKLANRGHDRFVIAGNAGDERRSLNAMAIQLLDPCIRESLGIVDG